MTPGRRICEAVHLIALGFWLGALVMAGTAAALIFPIMKGLKPALPNYGGYHGEHWMITGGQVAARVFWVCDVVQFVCMLIAGVTFGIAVMWLGLPQRRVTTFVRATLLLALLAILSYRLGFLEPGLTEALRGYWAAAQAGDNETAARLKGIFDQAHPMQTRLMGVTAGLVLAAIVAAVWSLAQGTAAANGPSHRAQEIA